MSHDERHLLSISNSISWTGDSDPGRRATLRLALDAFRCAIAMLDTPTDADLHWFKNELEQISGQYLRPGASSRSVPSGSGWSGRSG